MRLDLRRHPDTPAAAVTAATAAFERQDGRLWLRYVVDCLDGSVVTGGPLAPERTDGLWRSTCFEAFVQVGNGPAYAEYNFAPDGRWAAYRFDARREGMQPLDVSVPEIHLEGGADWFAIEVEIGHDADPAEELHLGLSAVIEETDGTKSYWALRHPPGPPDFHHSDCFAVTLEATAPA